jgi:hypothetical protein
MDGSATYKVASTHVSVHTKKQWVKVASTDLNRDMDGSTTWMHCHYVDSGVAVMGYAQPENEPISSCQHS